MTLLGPQWLVNQIGTISLILGAAILVLFSNFVNKRIVFPLGDLTKAKTQAGLKKGQYKGQGFLSKYIPDFLAALIFLVYVWLGAKVLADFIFVPILTRLSNVLLIVVIVIFLLFSWIINNATVRNRVMKG